MIQLFPSFLFPRSRVPPSRCSHCLPVIIVIICCKLVGRSALPTHYMGTFTPTPLHSLPLFLHSCARHCGGGGGVKYRDIVSPWQKGGRGEAGHTACSPRAGYACMVKWRYVQKCFLLRHLHPQASPRLRNMSSGQHQTPPPHP